jgi:predicted nucleic acid-binding protein
MIVVADSSPFVVLIAIGHVDVLPTLYGQVIVPPEVEAELGMPRRPEAVRSFIGSRPAWLKGQAPAAVLAISGLHAGEAAAIALAYELGADQLIIDEAPGRKAATERNLPVIGTIGVLELSAERGLLDLADAFDKVKRTDFWVSPKFLDERLSRFLQRTKPADAGGEGSS